MSKTGKKYQKYSAEFKLCVIMDMREHHLGLLETVMKYWDVPYKQAHCYVGNLHRWERIFLEEGAEGLMKERRGKSASGARRGRPLKLDKKVEEDLIAENQHLRQQLQYVKMENDYLKKLSALVLAEERKNGKRR